MSSDPYNERVRALFSAPVHAGSIEGGTSVLVDDQSVRIELCAKTQNDAILELRFHARGCPHLLAATEAFCAQYEGQAVSELTQFSVDKLMQSLAVPVEKSGRILVIEDAVRSLGAAIRETS